VTTIVVLEASTFVILFSAAEIARPMNATGVKLTKNGMREQHTFVQEDQPHISKVDFVLRTPYFESRLRHDFSDVAFIYKIGNNWGTSARVSAHLSKCEYTTSMNHVFYFFRVLIYRHISPANYRIQVR